MENNGNYAQGTCERVAIIPQTAAFVNTFFEKNL
jgi:hypothetical protein